jgi:TPR repeat protein
LKDDDADSLAGMGYCYLNGINVDKDVDNGFKLLLLAGQKKSVFAYSQLGKCYFEGIGTTQNDTLASVWYKKGVNVEDPACLLGLATCYELGRGIPKNQKKAFELCEQVVEGDKFTPAFNQLGTYYLHGIGTEKDEEEATYLFEMGAVLGDPDALYNRGECYEKEIGALSENYLDLDLAKVYYQVAARSGHVKAIDKLQTWEKKHPDANVDDSDEELEDFQEILDEL